MIFFLSIELHHLGDPSDCEMGLSNSFNFQSVRVSVSHKNGKELHTPQNKIATRELTGPDSLVVRASASGAVDRGFAPRSRHTKGVKNGTSSSLADARIKG